MFRATAFLALGVMLCTVEPALADDVLSGVDLYQALPTSNQSFTGPYALPADFFDPGSEPFTGTVSMQSPPPRPVGSCALLPIGPYTVTRRTIDAFFPGGETVPIELVQLALVSVEPITVSYPGGVTEQWDVQMTVTPGPTGIMNIQHGHVNGGTFTAQFPVRPQFSFQRVGDGAFRYFTPDVGEGDILAVGPAPWSHTPEAGMIELPGCTTNFFPGVIPPSPASAPTALPPSWVTFVGPYTSLSCVWPSSDPTGVGGSGPPSATRVSRAAPNPARGEVHLTIELPAASVVRVRVYDSRGRLVEDLGSRMHPAGRSGVVWQIGRQGRAPSLPAAGTYFLRVQPTGSRPVTRRVVVLP